MRVPPALLSPDGEIPVLACNDLCKTFRRRRDRSGAQTVVALRQVSLWLSAASSVALTGESGSGKTTLARCLASIEKPDSGEVYFEGAQLNGKGRRGLRDNGRQIQLIFQTTAAALNPRFSVLDLIEEPLRIRGGMSRRERRDRALATLERVGLDAALQHHRPFEISGGQKQRVAVARALLMDAKVLIFDEALAGLDDGSRTKLTGLLADLQQSFALTYLFITHDLRSLAGVVSRVLSMRCGMLNEIVPQASEQTSS